MNSPATDKLIMIVDRSPNSGLIVSSMIESWGFKTSLVHSLTGAVEVITKEKKLPDLILVEILGTQEDAFALPVKIRSAAPALTAPIIAHSVLAEREAVVKAIKNGYADYIVRPTEPDILKEKLTKFFQPTTDISEATFPIPIAETGSTEFKWKLTAINEFGMEAYGEIPLDPNQVIPIKSDFLEKFQLSKTEFRVTGCMRVPSGPEKFKVAFSFVALPPKTAREIRQFCIRNGKKSPERAA